MYLVTRWWRHRWWWWWWWCWWWGKSCGRYPPEYQIDVLRLLQNKLLNKLLWFPSFPINHVSYMMRSIHCVPAAGGMVTHYHLDALTCSARTHAPQGSGNLFTQSAHNTWCQEIYVIFHTRVNVVESLPPEQIAVYCIYSCQSVGMSHGW